MSEPRPLSSNRAAANAPWDARLARRLVMPLRDSWVTPNYLTSVRLAVGLAAAAAFTPGSYDWSNFGAILLVLSNFLDHTDGELARISGKSSRFGHVYDLASDALVTVLLFLAIGIGVDAGGGYGAAPSPILLGLGAGSAIALIFYLRMRIESLAGKSASRQASVGGFETEDVMYLLPLVSLSDCLRPFLLAAAIGAPLFAVWVLIDYRRVLRRRPPLSAASSSGAA